MFARIPDARMSNHDSKFIYVMFDADQLKAVRAGLQLLSEVTENTGFPVHEEAVNLQADISLVIDILKNQGENPVSPGVSHVAGELPTVTKVTLKEATNAQSTETTN